MRNSTSTRWSVLLSRLVYLVMEKFREAVARELMQEDGMRICATGGLSSNYFSLEKPWTNMIKFAYQHPFWGLFASLPFPTEKLSKISGPKVKRR